MRYDRQSKNSFVTLEHDKAFGDSNSAGVGLSLSCCSMILVREPSSSDGRRIHSDEKPVPTIVAPSKAKSMKKEPSVDESTVGRKIWKPAQFVSLRFEVSKLSLYELFDSTDSWSLTKNE
jgi:hypothetical protein